MDTKTILSKGAIGLRSVLVVLSIFSTMIIGLTCLVFMFTALMFCDTCSGIGDWVKSAGLPLGTMGAVVLASTLIGIVLNARQRWVVGVFCLAVSPGLILVGAVSPTIGQVFPVFAIAAIPLQMYHDQQHILEVQRAGDSLIAQAGRVIAGQDGPPGQEWHRTDAGQIEFDGLSLELCNAAANSASRQRPALRAKCKHISGVEYNLTVEDPTSLKPE